MIKRIQIYGERNSGTNYLSKLVDKNIEGVKTTNDFGWKHGDLGDVMKFYKEDGTFVEPKATKATKSNTEDVLLIVIFRNPFTWLQSMHRSPHHAPKSWFTNMRDFLRIPWESYYSKVGQPSSQDREYAMECVKPENLHEKFDNVIQLRNSKLRTELSFAKRVPNVAYVNYEDLSANKDKVLSSIAKAYGLKLKTKVKDITEDKFGGKEYKPKVYTPLSLSDVRFVTEELDTKQEASIGYVLDTGKLKSKQKPGWLARLFGKEASVEDPSQFLSYDFKLRFIKDGKEVKYD